ncbi:MAG: LuxR C-terminal-related transcriptional regulator [Chloroflexi bacterium]|nr:LuxR C-terminal-related transcriptional regulator [Chloroflexota bacterium]
MSAPILATKLYIPPPRLGIVSRPRLIERLNEGLSLDRKLALISASAGFGKTTLLSAWITDCGRPVAWLSLDESDSDLSRFLVYLVSAIQTIAPQIGVEILAALQTSQPPPVETLLTSLLNEISTLPDDPSTRGDKQPQSGQRLILVLDDYHLLDSKVVDAALTFLVEHLPPQMHLVIATREDPSLPLARLRARGQLTEIRAADLRFTSAEATEFLNRMMGRKLSDGDVAALEARTEGWIAGLQLAALSMQGQKDTAGFIHSFTGSNRFVLDYLLEEVLQHQPPIIQNFLLRTSILDRMCGPLCDAVLGNDEGGGIAKRDEREINSDSSSLILHPSSFMLEYLEHTNLFIVPLDNERRWYRYHHLFGDLLRQRLVQSLTPEAIAEYHIRASEWHEINGLLFEAFRHAAAADDIERAKRLIESKGMPLHFRGVAMSVLDWLASLPTMVLDAKPWLRVKSATLALIAGQTTGVEEKLQAAERALLNIEPDAGTRDLIGQVACARATLALTRYEPEVMLTQARRALEYLRPDNLAFRFTANWALGMAHHFRGERAAASRAYTEAIAISQASGDIFSTILATTSLGQIQELENQLYQADETYRRVLQLFGDHPQPNAAEVYLGLARICYEWNDLESAGQYGEQSLQLARQYDRVIDRFIISEVFLSHLKLARGDVDGAAAMLAQTEQSARQKNFILRLPEIAAAQVLVLLRQGNLDAAADLTQTHELPLSRARVLLAQGDTSAALAVLKPLRQQMESRDWKDEQLKVMILEAVVHHVHGEKEKAMQLLGDVLALAKPSGFIRTFVDEGLPMAQLLSEAATHGVMPEYIGKLLAAFEAENQKSEDNPDLLPAQSLIEPLSQRELDVLRLIAEGLSNQEICERLFLALDTVKGHNRRIFNKLQVERRTEAIVRARELGLL